MAFSASTKDSKQLYDEIVARLTAAKPEFPAHLAEIQAKLGITRHLLADRKDDPARPRLADPSGDAECRTRPLPPHDGR